MIMVKHAFLVALVARCEVRHDSCARRDLSSHVSVRDKKMCPRPKFCNAFLQAGLTDLDEIWHDGGS